MAEETNLGISEQFVVSAISHLRFPNLGHSVSQVIGSIANGIQSRVSSFLAALEMSGLGDHPTSKDADSNRVRGLFHMILSIAERHSRRFMPPLQP